MSEAATTIHLRQLCCPAPGDAEARLQAAWLLEGLSRGYIVGNVDRAQLESLAAPAQTDLPRGRRIDWAALRDWVDAHLAQALDVAALAARVHLSPTQFAVRCKDELGFSPMALVRQQRLAMALQLRRAGVPVARIAASCGYRSPSALTAALKREALTP